MVEGVVNGPELGDQSNIPLPLLLRVSTATAAMLGRGTAHCVATQKRPDMNRSLPGSGLSVGGHAGILRMKMNTPRGEFMKMVMTLNGRVIATDKMAIGVAMATAVSKNMRLSFRRCGNGTCPGDPAAMSAGPAGDRDAATAAQMTPLLAAVGR